MTARDTSRAQPPQSGGSSPADPKAESDAGPTRTLGRRLRVAASVALTFAFGLAAYFSEQWARASGAVLAGLALLLAFFSQRRAGS
jgi:hypothetical protein